MGKHRVKKHSSKNFKSEKHRAWVTFSPVANDRVRIAHPRNQANDRVHDLWVWPGDATQNPCATGCAGDSPVASDDHAWPRDGFCLRSPTMGDAGPTHSACPQRLQLVSFYVYLDQIGRG